MHVEFKLHEGQEYVEYSGHHGKDVVLRPASEEDKAAHPEAYAAFLATLPSPSATPESTDTPAE